MSAGGYVLPPSTRSLSNSCRPSDSCLPWLRVRFAVLRRHRGLASSQRLDPCESFARSTSTFISVDGIYEEGEGHETI